MTRQNWLFRLLRLRQRPLLERLAAPVDDMLQVLVDDSGIGIAIIDRDGGIVRVNRCLRQLVDSSLDLAPGRAVIEIFCPDRQAEVQGEIEQALLGLGPPYRFTTMLRPCDGLQPTVTVLAVPLREADEQISGVILELLDISAQRRLEDQLAHSQKFEAVGQLAAGIAHDFNNLLTAILGASDEALERGPRDQVTLEDLHQIHTSAERGADLVRQLLAFSRQQALQPRVLAINDAVLKLSTLLRRLMGAKVQVDLQFEFPSYMVRVDPTQLDQVLINLAVNSRHAMPGGGKLTLRTGHSTLERAMIRGSESIPAGRYVVITVQDTGVGIPADVLSRIFDPFFTTRREQGGSGLGLSTVHGIIRQSGGYLEVVSEEGKGAKFCIYLPRHEAPDVATPKVVPPSLVAPPPAAGRHVLLVEDEDGVRRLAVRALTQRGWTVVSADSGEAALDLFHEDPTLLGMLCAVVSDVVMPGIDGAALVRIIRDLRPDLPAILTSGYAEEAVRSASLIEDVLILSKPYTLKVLQETLEQKALRQPPSMSRSNQPISP